MIDSPMFESHIALNVDTFEKKGKGGAKSNWKGGRQEHKVVGHKRYVNPAMSLNKLYSPENIMFG